MKNKIILLIVGFVFVCFLSKAQGNFLWGKDIGGLGGYDDGYSTAVDAAGNIYTTGNFLGTVDFDPGPGVYTLTAVGQQDIFICKLDASGNFVWAKKIGGIAYDSGRSITVDASGNVYTTGFFMIAADFDPGLGVYNLTSVSVQDIFLSKLDASGNFVWAKNMGGSTGDIGYSIAVDAGSNVYSTGTFQGMVDFDPGPGVYTLTTSGAFISKLDASGNFVWAKQFTLSDSHSIALDQVGNVYTTGLFYNTTDFDPGAGVYNLIALGLNSDVFISKLDASGNFIWAKQLGGIGEDVSNSIAIDLMGNVYTTGYFNVTADFDPGVGVNNMISIGTDDVFVSKLDALGTFVWAKQLGGASADVSQSVAVDLVGNVYTSGYFIGTADFDPGVGVYNLSSALSSEDIFISKLDPLGLLFGLKTLMDSLLIVVSQFIIIVIQFQLML